MRSGECLLWSAGVLDGDRCCARTARFEKKGASLQKIGAGLHIWNSDGRVPDVRPSAKFRGAPSSAIAMLRLSNSEVPSIRRSIAMSGWESCVQSGEVSLCANGPIHQPSGMFRSDEWKVDHSMAILAVRIQGRLSDSRTRTAVTGR